jgi:hypothetical protein
MRLFVFLWLLMLSSLVFGYYVDNEIIPTFEVSTTNILFNSIAQNVDMIPEYDSIYDIKDQDYLKYSLMKIPQEKSFIISERLQDDIFDSKFNGSSSNGKLGKPKMFSRSYRFYQYTLEGAGVRDVADDNTICVPNNTTSIASYIYTREFSKISGFDVAMAFSRIFGFAPKLQFGFYASSCINFEVGCDVSGGRYLQLGKSFRQFYWNNVTRRQVVLNASPLKTKIQFSQLEYFSEIVLADKSNLQFTCISKTTCESQ